MSREEGLLGLVEHRVLPLQPRGVEVVVGHAGQDALALRVAQHLPELQGLDSYHPVVLPLAGQEGVLLVADLLGHEELLLQLALLLEVGGLHELLGAIGVFVLLDDVDVILVVFGTLLLLDHVLGTVLLRTIEQLAVAGRGGRIQILVQGQVGHVLLGGHCSVGCTIVVRTLLVGLGTGAVARAGGPERRQGGGPRDDSRSVCRRLWL